MATACLVPSLLYVLVMFVYPFLYGIYMSLRPAKVAGFSLANYLTFFGDEWQYRTVWITFNIAVPNTVVVVSVALLLAYGMRRGIWLERTVTTILVLPISLGVILLAEGIIGFYGARGWFNQLLLGLGLLNEPLVLTHNYIGVMLSLFMQQFPFCFLMLLGYISGIDPSIENSARTLGAGPWTVFYKVMLPLMAPGIAIAFALVFVMSFGVFPSAILLGQPAGATRTIAIAAYQQAFESYDMSYASAIAVIMGVFQMAGLVIIVLLRRRMVMAATMGVGKR
ncbi:MAG: ABC transporter permease [candidate division NC10 bacterium RIFCSPLOWO2_12_FULL_66_18]|nr:MAG: ABC transporter permease [candidate division NC10 bacterium RIFCSPLOWO2_02_FULL_66_22]OGB96553.1 MAG: ABC transporter permease [candidate division NC10 bacterium RIFCSPLOWO2_12_FULL_66_18]